MNEPRNDAPDSKREFLHRLVLMDGMALLFLLVLAGLWYAADALLLIFACILFAILLYGMSDAIRQRLHLRRKFALPLVVALLLAIIGIGGWLMAPQIADQSDKLAEAIPHAIEELRKSLNQNDLARRLLHAWQQLLPGDALAVEVVCHGGPPDSPASLTHAARLWGLALEPSSFCTSASLAAFEPSLLLTASSSSGSELTAEPKVNSSASIDAVPADRATTR